MAKTIEEIVKELNEWVNENSAERSVMLIAGDEEGNIHVTQMGKKREVATCVASVIESYPDVENLITKSLDIVKEYRKDKQKTENN